MVKKLTKRVLPLLLAVLMLFSVMPMQAFAEDTSTATGYVTKDYEGFVYNLALLEEVAALYVAEVKHDADPLNLVIKYIRTGVDRYNSGSWNIMAGYEDEQFAEFVAMLEESINVEAPSEEEKIKMTGLKNIQNFALPNGEVTDIGHMFGTMDITYHNNGSQNHADVGGWAGDLVDLLELCDIKGVSGDVEAMAKEIREKYLANDFTPNPGFSMEDFYGDLDAYYIMKTLSASNYEMGMLTQIICEYFTEELNNEARAKFLLTNRLATTGTRTQIREAVLNAYNTNKVVTTLEATREFTTNDIISLRKAVCYAFADYLCELAGDYVDSTENPYFEVFSSTTSVLAPGITQEIKQATSADNKQMVYYLATADITRNDVDLFANYNNNDPAAGWEMSRVIDQANAAQEKYGNPDSEHYIENYNVIASTNGAGYNMETGEPSGLLVMGGVEYHPINANGFVGILDDGTPIIASTQEYNTIYKGKVRDAIAVFGETLVKDGKIVVSKTTNYFSDRASRTAIGITKTGKVVLMVLDGRQEPISCGGSMVEIAQIMLDAGCVHAVNLDGGGSTTFVAKQPGDDELSVVNKPSDGFSRSVSTSLMMVSTAPSSTKFDHAVIESDYDYLTVNSSVKLNPVGVSATGNAAELPEDTHWEVSDSRWATVSEDGVFTALRNGQVDVYLMSGDTVIGSKSMNIVIPDNLYFTKNPIDAVYGETVNLPLVLTYENKKIAYNTADYTMELSIEDAGTVSGTQFVGNEASNIKVVLVTATLANTQGVTAEVTINLYKQGEASFDFDQATGGDRQLAWYREVTNATTEDSITYMVENVNEDMVTSYTVALDMTHIPIPPTLEDLIYMLPGADVAGANAWKFLCQLAERVSAMTQVKAELVFDKDVSVDYSGLTLVNEYFTLYSSSLDEETNKLTIILKWKKQSHAIDESTANPMCIVSGIKLTPKADASWDAKNKLEIVNTGSIGYDIYLRANALYSFALKTENQEQYGIYPFVNPDLPSETGGYLSNVYKEFNDSYTLVNALTNGWVSENGGYAYYVDGEKLTGVKEVDGFYYDFGNDGINAAQTKLSGVFLDEEAGVYRYCKNGVLTSGWNMIGTDWYYFRSSTMAAATGRTKVGGVYFDFEENGKLKSGVWANTLNGTRYYYGPSYYLQKWQLIDGNWYYFINGYRVTGVTCVRERENAHIKQWFDFGEDGIARDLEDGLHEIDGDIYYLIDGKHQIGLHKVDGSYYFFTYAGPAVRGQSYYAWETHCDLPCSNYAFGPDGKMVDGLAVMNDGTYYYVNGKVVSDKAGLTKIGDDYYFISAKGKCATGKYYAWATNCDLPCGNYEFGEDGKLLQGIVEKEDGVYYYVNGKINSKYAGLTKVGDDYYFVAANGRCATGKYYAWATNCDLPCSEYEFGADGKMLQGIVEKENGIYCYVNGKLGGNVAGLTKVGDDYYFIASNGKVATGKYYAWATNCDLPCGNYEFGADGKMLNGFVTKADGIYYYVNGKTGTVGLNYIDGYYYFVNYSGKLVVNTTYYIWESNGLLIETTYTFDANGRIVA